VWAGIVSESIKEAALRELITLNTLPSSIIDKLLQEGSVPATVAQHCDSVAISFTDIVGFTKLSTKLTAGEVVNYLNSFFSFMDEQAVTFGIEKIKTIGDCYMAVSGCPVGKSDYLEAMVDFLIAVLSYLKQNTIFGHPTLVRIGVHCGPVVAGVIGKTKLSYDVWGEAVNKASRLQSQGAVNAITISEEIYQLIKDNNKYQVTSNGQKDLAGIGTVNVFLVNTKSTDNRK